MINKLLQRQLRKATNAEGVVDLETFKHEVVSAYQEYEHALKMQEHASQLMSDELIELNSALRKERDEIVLQSQKRFELAVEGANDGIWDWNVKSDSLWLSPRCRTMLGYPAGQSQGCHIADWYAMLNAEDLEKAKNFIEVHLKDQPRYPITLRFNDVSGKIHYIMCRASVLKDSSGQAARLVGVHTDITNLMAMQEELKLARDKADAANNAKSDFLANMSHELRTPLNSILGMVRLLLATTLDEEQKEIATTAYQSSSHLLEIVNDILDLSKIEANEIHLENIGFDLNYVLKNVIASMQHLASEKRILLIKDDAKIKFPYVIGDPTRLSRVLTNLIGNAIKYTDKGYVQVKSNFEMNGENAINFKCEIIDSGIGIDPEKHQSIFNKFVQADTSTTRRYGGSGLGLAITKQLLELMGGLIGVRSQLGQGSTFWFSLPLVITTQLDANSQETRRRPYTGILQAQEARVLIAEDNLMNRLLLTKLMQRFGIQHFKIVDDGREVLQAYKDEKWDVVLMDVHMPELNGYEATVAIRKLEKDAESHIPIVAMTANAMVGEREKCLRHGMDDYISKPMDMDELLDILRQWIKIPLGLTKGEPHEPVDLSNIRDLASGDVKFEKELVRAFIKQGDQNIAALSTYCVDGVSHGWTEAAHTFKGSSNSIGAAKLGFLCAEAQAMEACSQDERKLIIAQIKAEYQSAKEFFERQGFLA